MEKYIIDRSKWRCGASNVESKRGDGRVLLENNLGYMCCLGQICKQYDSKLNIKYLLSPESLDVHIPKFNEEREDSYGRDYIDTILSGDLMGINDEIYITDEERESKIIERALQDNIIIEFINEYTIIKKP